MEQEQRQDVLTPEETPQTVPVREIAVITKEIRDICAQAQSMALFFAVEIGRRLTEAKAALPHGAWGEWLRNEVQFSQRTANNFMNLFDQYGSEQISLFGAIPNSQALANLPYTKALQLLALPAEERESFAEENNVAGMTTRELAQALKERDAARKEAEEARERAEKIEESEKELETIRAELEQARREIKAKESEAQSARQEAERLKAAKSTPSKTVLDKYKKEAQEKAEQAAKRRMEDCEKKLRDTNAALEEAKATAEELQRKADLAAQQAEQTRKENAMNHPKVTEFKVLFDSIQDTLNRMDAITADLTAEDPATADKLRSALRAVLTKKLEGLEAVSE